MTCDALHKVYNINAVIRQHLRRTDSGPEKWRYGPIILIIFAIILVFSTFLIIIPAALPLALHADQMVFTPFASHRKLESQTKANTTRNWTISGKRHAI